MILTEPMKQLVAVVLDHDSDRVTRELLGLGVMHFIRVTEVDPQLDGRVEGVTLRVTEAVIAETRKRIEKFLVMGGRQPASAGGLSLEDLRALDPDETNRWLDGLAGQIQDIRSRQQELQQEILKLEDIRRQLEMFGDLSAGLRARSSHSFLNIQTGAVRPAFAESLAQALNDVPSVLIGLGEVDGQATLLLITMRRDDAAVGKLLDKFGWTDVEIPKPGAAAQDQAIGELENRLSGLRAEQEGLEAKAGDLVRQRAPELEGMWRNLRLNELFVKIQSYFSCTARTVILSGWVPAAVAGRVEAAIRGAAAGGCYLEWHDAEDVSETGRVPVQLRTPAFLAPFQMLVKNYSIPQYGTVDPTVFATVAYLIMFGLMFGDAGHGLVLLLLGWLGARAARRRGGNLANLLRLIAWCGGAAVVAGVLFGSYFGQPWFRPLWFDYHGAVLGHGHGGWVRDVYGILKLTIYFGIGVIGSGLGLNWVNQALRRRWFDLVFDKKGLVGGWIYGCGVYAGFYFVRHQYRELPGGAALAWWLGLPVVLLAAKPLAHAVRTWRGRRRDPYLPVNALMEWLVEILEVFSGYLANTLSFMRVAGLGIAHVSLVGAFFAIADMLRGSGGGYSVWSYLTVAAGHVLVIGLEGLSAGIQSLRLNYYEFFSKYFTGAGLAYTPVSLRGRQ